MVRDSTVINEENKMKLKARYLNAGSIFSRVFPWLIIVGLRMVLKLDEFPSLWHSRFSTCSAEITVLFLDFKDSYRVSPLPSCSCQVLEARTVVAMRNFVVYRKERESMRGNQREEESRLCSFINVSDIFQTSFVAPCLKSWQDSFEREGKLLYRDFPTCHHVSSRAKIWQKLRKENIR